MGLSFDDETSLKEVADGLRFAAGGPYKIHEMRSIDKENDSICEIDDTQMSERQTPTETIDKSILEPEFKDTGGCIHKDEDPVESV